MKRCSNGIVTVANRAGASKLHGLTVQMQGADEGAEQLANSIKLLGAEEAWWQRQAAYRSKPPSPR